MVSYRLYLYELANKEEIKVVIWTEQTIEIAEDSPSGQAIAAWAADGCLEQGYNIYDGGDDLLILEDVLSELPVGELRREVSV